MNEELTLRVIERTEEGMRSYGIEPPPPLAEDD